MNYETFSNVAEIATTYNFNAAMCVIGSIPFVLFIGAMLKRSL